MQDLSALPESNQQSRNKNSLLALFATLAACLLIVVAIKVDWVISTPRISGSYMPAVAPRSSAPMDNQGATPVTPMNSEKGGALSGPVNEGFGIVNPGATLSRTIKVPNTSNVNWKVERIETTCSCTVAGVESSSISPGEMLVAEVRLATPAKSYDVLQTVNIFLRAGGSLKYLQIQLSASVREPLTAFPDTEVLIANSATADRPVEVFIRNYGKTVLSDPVVATSHPWLDARIAEDSEMYHDRLLGASQLWRVLIAPNSSTLQTGQHSAKLTFTAKGPGETPSTVTLPVHLRLQAPYLVIPPQVFFGEVGAQGAVREVVLRFRPGSAPSDASDIECVLSGDMALSVTIEKRTELEWLLRFSYTAKPNVAIKQTAAVYLRHLNKDVTISLFAAPEGSAK